MLMIMTRSSSSLSSTIIVGLLLFVNILSVTTADKKSSLFSQKQKQALGLNNSAAKCSNGQQFDTEFQPGVIGADFYDYLVENTTGVVQSMTLYRVAKENDAKWGMSSSWLLIVMSCVPMAILWIFCGFILFSLIRKTDKLLTLDEFFDVKED